MFILLPLSQKGLPKDIDEKKEIIHTILDEAVRQGLCKEDIIVDDILPMEQIVVEPEESKELSDSFDIVEEDFSETFFEEETEETEETNWDLLQSVVCPTYLLDCRREVL